MRLQRVAAPPKLFDQAVPFPVTEIGADEVTTVLSAYRVERARLVPRGVIFRTENTLWVNIYDWQQIFPPPGWSRYTVGVREARRDRSRSARKPPIAYSTP